MAVQGKCLCGAIRFECASVPLVGFCHCSRCRKAYGGPFAAEAVVPAGDFKFVTGADFLGGYRTSDEVERSFCTKCGSRAPFLALAGKSYIVPIGLFDDDPGTRPSFHMFVASKAPWWEIIDDLPQFEEGPPGYDTPNT